MDRRARSHSKYPRSPALRRGRPKRPVKLSRARRAFSAARIEIKKRQRGPGDAAVLSFNHLPHDRGRPFKQRLGEWLVDRLPFSPCAAIELLHVSANKRDLMALPFRMLDPLRLIQLEGDVVLIAIEYVFTFAHRDQPRLIRDLTAQECGVEIIDCVELRRDVEHVRIRLREFAQTLVLSIIGSTVERQAVVRSKVSSIRDVQGVPAREMVAQLELVVEINALERQVCVPTLVLFLLKAGQHWCCFQIRPMFPRLFVQKGVSERKF